MSFPAVHLFEFNNQDLRDMVLLVTLIHRVFPDAAGIFRIPRCWRPDSPAADHRSDLSDHALLQGPHRGLKRDP